MTLLVLVCFVYYAVTQLLPTEGSSKGSLQAAAPVSPPIPPQPPPSAPSLCHVLHRHLFAMLRCYLGAFNQQSHTEHIELLFECISNASWQLLMYVTQHPSFGKIPFIIATSKPSLGCSTWGRH